MLYSFAPAANYSNRSKIEAENSAGRDRQRIEIEETRKRQDGQEKTGAITVVFEPTARGIAEQSRSS
jgi:metal-responsive CopG/Arc/MetJ family transcriptional regulator